MLRQMLSFLKRYKKSYWVNTTYVYASHGISSHTQSAAYYLATPHLFWSYVLR